jgi:hypothetical protein
MLTAKTTSKRLLIAPEGIENELREMGRDKFLICPACEGNVYFRSGSFTPHFVHYSAECIVRFSEPETKEHLAVKWALYSALKKQGLPAELEHYVPETGQRADVWTVSRGQPVALEVQMSSIPNRMWRERQELYDSEGIKSVWYLGFNPKWAGENDFPLGSTSAWESLHLAEPTAVESTYHAEWDEYLRLYARVHIRATGKDVKWLVQIYYLVNEGYGGEGGRIALVDLHMDEFRIFRWCPDTEDGKLFRIVRNFLKDYPVLSNVVGRMPRWWNEKHIKELFTPDGNASLVLRPRNPLLHVLEWFPPQID